MDSITGATVSGASRLSFAQKVVASGMSLVLAFGLSPLGQTPAYATGGDLQTQEASQLETQDAVRQFSSVSVALNTTPDSTATWKYNQPLVYNGGNQQIKFGITDSKDEMIDSTASGNVTATLYKGSKDKIAGKTPESATSTGGVYNIKDAGTYTVVLEGTGATYPTASITYEFEVAKLDLSTVAFHLDQDADGYTGSPYVMNYNGTAQKVTFTPATPETGTAPTLLAGTDYDSDTDTVESVGDYTASLTGKGNCTGTATVNFEVQAVPFLTGSANAIDPNVKLNGADVVNVGANATNAADFTAGITGADGSTAIEPVTVPYNKAGSPIELTYNGVKLAEKTDYTVKYYAANDYDATAKTSTKGTTALTSIPTTLGAVYYADITVSNRAKFTNTADALNRTIHARLIVGAGKFDSTADRAELASVKYLGDGGVAPETAGATFYKGDKDVTTAIGEHFVIGNDYDVLSTNTASTAQKGTSTNPPIGAGDYYVTVTGATDYFGTSGVSGNMGIPASFTIEPRAAVEGTGIGDLAITVADQPYTGTYLTMAPNTKDLKVEIYTSKSGDKSLVSNEVAPANTVMKEKVTNWKVTYYQVKNGSDVKVDKPLEAGDYKAVFEFSGNLAGTEPITKEFKVETGDIATQVSAIDDIDAIYTGNAVVVDKDSVQFLNPTGTANLTAVQRAALLEESDFELSFDGDTPVNAGSYAIKATFSGKYAGTVEGTITIAKLNLATLANAEVQYLQEDGSYDSVYSVPANSDGSAIVPSFRIAVKDDKVSSDEPTLVNEDVYSATFSTNTSAGPAKVKFAANSGYEGNVRAGADLPAFTITTGSLSGAGASVKLDKASADFSVTGAKGTSVSVPSNAGTLSYPKVNAGGQPVGYVTSVSTKTVHYDPETAKTVVTDGTKPWVEDTLASSTPVAGELHATSEITASPAYNYSVRVIDPDGVEMTAWDGVPASFQWGESISIEPNYDDPTKVKVGMNEHYVNAAGVGQASSTGNTTVSEFKKAGDYTIVIGPGTSNQYGGRKTATFTVTPQDISNANAFAVAYNKWNDNTSVRETIPYSGDWSLDYDAEAAKTRSGIVHQVEITSHGDDTLTVTPATGTALKEKNAANPDGDYTVEYADNKAAGEATVTFKGVGNYTGEVVKTFTINRAKVVQTYKRSNGTAAADGYIVDFDASAFTKNAAGDKVIYYTGSAITPNYVVNYYTAGSDTPSFVLEGDYTAQWINNTNVYYVPNMPDVDSVATVRITATGNYQGTIDGTFRIEPVDLYNNSEVTVEDVADVPFTGSKVVPNVVVKRNGAVLEQGKDYVVTSDNDGSVGEHTVYVASANQGNYTVSTPIAKTFQIKKAEEITYDLTGATVELSAASFTYNGAIQAPTVSKVTLKNGTVLTADQFKATIPADSTNAGPYTVKVEGAQANVTGSAEAAYTIAKANNPLKVAKATRTAKKVSKKKAVVKGLNVKKAGQGTMTYKKVSVKKGKKAAAKKLAKKILVNKTTGKITVKKGLAKGTYKVTISAKAAGNGNYEESNVLKAIVTLKVKK